MEEFEKVRVFDGAKVAQSEFENVGALCWGKNCPRSSSLASFEWKDLQAEKTGFQKEKKQALKT